MTKTQHDSATPAHGEQVISAVVFAHRQVNGEHQIFLAKRADTKAFLPGVYEMPGGHIDFGEDIVDGLKREIKEELKVDVSIGDSFACFTYENKVKGSHSIQVGFFAQFVDPIENIRIDPEDHSTVGWFTRKEIDAAKDQVISPPYNGGIHYEDEDPEWIMIMKGFDILEGKPLDLG